MEGSAKIYSFKIQTDKQVDNLNMTVNNDIVGITYAIQNDTSQVITTDGLELLKIVMFLIL